mgnify:CR=1 FL=1
MQGPLLLPFNGVSPRIHRSAWIAPNATIIGDVEIGPDASVFYGCVLRGEGGRAHDGESVSAATSRTSRAVWPSGETTRSR